MQQAGKVQEAIEQYAQALRINPDDPKVQNTLAWLLATHTDVGDPARAVTLAERACKLTNNQVATCLDTLAAAYATAGRFDDAIASAQTAIELARAHGQTELMSKVQSRLDLYRGGHAYRQPIVATPQQSP